MAEARAAKWRTIKKKSFIRLPPDADSLRQHCLRANYLAYLVRHPSLKHHPSPIGHGWELVGGCCRPVRHTRPALPMHLPAPRPTEEGQEDESDDDDENRVAAVQRGDSSESEDSECSEAGILTSNNATDEILLEGDLLAPKTRNAMKCWSQSCLWKKGSRGLVTVPFTTSSQFTSSERQTITNAMNAFHSQTCLRFVPRRNEQGCVHHGTVQHEINHALGFHHEQTRSDRDSYVRINWQNINPQMAYNFKRHDTNNLNTPYDYGSIMHYGRTAFSIQWGKDSMTPIPNPNVQIGQRRGLSRGDIVRINKLYQC
ncbi:hypothetical protein KUCAC02_002049 [Chaenocephalus aceratus]|uniref:Uncharacterized protein n=1 Tax=Chaenocephalus aceratus TaxID=36190 RepID=A0ACB9XU24_CHAAC|nr:hypothetical protein KUCAC02_002049 [Chaenocephalus aceratus]